MKLRDFLSKYKSTVIVVIIVLLVAIFIIPFIINLLFKIKAPIELFGAEWNAEDALSFYGSFLSLLGTVVLGAVTVYQTNKAHQQTEKANNIAEQSNELAIQMQRLEQAHFVSIVSISYFKKFKVSGNIVEIGNANDLFKCNPIAEIDLTDDGYDNTKKYIIDITLKNNSDYPIVKMKSRLELVYSNIRFVEGTKERRIRFDIAPKAEQSVRFIFPQNAFCKHSSHAVKINIKFANAFGFVTPTNLFIDDLDSNYNQYSFNTEELTISDITEII